jgi:hypothetical protein
LFGEIVNGKDEKRVVWKGQVIINVIYSPSKGI